MKRLARIAKELDKNVKMLGDPKTMIEAAQFAGISEEDFKALRIGQAIANVQ